MKLLARLLSPDAVAGNGDGDGASVRAKISTPPQADGLDTMGISDAVDFLDVPDHLKAKVKTKEGDTTPTAEQKAAGELAARAKAGGRSVADQKTFEAAEAAKGGNADEIAKPEFSQDKQAWLDLRAKATTPEEIAELEKEMPEFTEDEAAWINAQADAADKAGDDKGDDEVEAPEFTDEQKPYVEKMTADLTEAKAKLAEVESKRSELEAKVTELENAAPPVAANLHPLAMVDSPEAIDTYETSLEQFIDWGRKNWDGSEEVKDDATGKVKQRAYTAEEIRDAVTRRESELRKVIPAARDALKQRQAEAATASTIYPAFANPKSEESKLASAILKQFPALKAMPNVMTVIGDAIAGERARKAAAKKTGAFRIGPKVAPKVAPKASAGGAGTRVAPKGKKDKGPDVKRFLDAKKTAPNETAALAATLGDGY